MRRHLLLLRRTLVWLGQRRILCEIRAEFFVKWRREGARPPVPKRRLSHLVLQGAALPFVVLQFERELAFLQSERRPDLAQEPLESRDVLLLRRVKCLPAELSALLRKVGQVLRDLDQLRHQLVVLLLPTEHLVGRQHAVVDALRPIPGHLGG